MRGGDADEAATRRAHGRVRPLSMLLNSTTVIGGKVATMGLGFLFWLIAARQFEPAAVGLAAGVVSAMMLCTQLALLGIGSAVIARFPQHAARPAALLNTSFSVVVLTSAVTACVFLGGASAALDELRVVAAMPLYAALFVAMSILGTLGIVLDQTSIALRRGDQVLVRGILFGVVTIALLVVVARATGAETSIAIFVPWVFAGVAAVAIGSVQLARTVRGYRFRPSLERGVAAGIVRVGLPNYFLTLTERAPGLILPVVVTELLSPASNAAWYAAWMMAWVVYIVPISVGLALFAEATHRPESLRAVVVHGVRSSLGIGVAAAVAVAALAPLLLSLLGPAYASAGTTPLRILVGAVVPLAIVQAYFSACRARHKLQEAIWTGAASGAAAVIAAAVAAVASGLTAMATAWLATQVLTGLWALWRLRSLGRRPAAGDAVRPRTSATGARVVRCADAGEPTPAR